MQQYPSQTFITLDIGGTKIAGALAQTSAGRASSPELFAVRTIPTDAQCGGEAVLKRVINLAHELQREATDPLAAIGVGTAGRIDATTGTIAYANDLMPGWMGQPLGQALRDAFDVPIAVLNDVHAHALGEARWGAGVGTKNSLVIAVGTGIAAGLIIDGTVVSGAHGFAGDMGITGNPRACVRTSNETTLEAVASGSGIEARYATLGGTPLRGGEISARASAGEELAQRVIEDAGFALGYALADWVSILDPECVIISGSVTKAGRLWKNAMTQAFSERAPSPLVSLPIYEAHLGDNAPLIGAAEYACDLLAESHV